jgi:hypothetical protein
MTGGVREESIEDMTSPKRTNKRPSKRNLEPLCAALAKAAPFVLALAALLREIHPYLANSLSG